MVDAIHLATWRRLAVVLCLSAAALGCGDDGESLTRFCLLARLLLALLIAKMVARG